MQLNLISFTCTRAQPGAPPPPIATTADDAGDGQANVYTLKGLPMHSCALHHRGREVPPGRTKTRPDGWDRERQEERKGDQSFA